MPSRKVKEKGSRKIQKNKTSKRKFFSLSKNTSKLNTDEQNKNNTIAGLALLMLYKKLNIKPI